LELKVREDALRQVEETRDELTVQLREAKLETGKGSFDGWLMVHFFSETEKKNVLRVHWQGVVGWVVDGPFLLRN
jgi:hypothetical protein